MVATTSSTTIRQEPYVFRSRLGPWLIRASIDAPAKLKRELDAVLTLQTELNQIDTYIQQVQKLISEE